MERLPDSGGEPYDLLIGVANALAALVVEDYTEPLQERLESQVRRLLLLDDEAFGELLAEAEERRDHVISSVASLFG